MTSYNKNKTTFTCCATVLNLLLAEISFICKNLVSINFRHRSDHTEVNLITDGVQPRRSNHPLGLVGVGHFLKPYAR